MSRYIDADIIAWIIRLLPIALNDVNDDERAAFKMAALIIEKYAEIDGVDVADEPKEVRE